VIRISDAGEPAEYCREARGPNMDVADWLRQLGLERYEPTFRENRIDADLLPRTNPLSRDWSARDGPCVLERG
jgi:hypothetical protein